MAYVYRHIRLDKNQPFYIGIGKLDNNYVRSRAKYGRNKIWKSIVSITDYIIEIIFDDLTLEEALAKEVELIALYGRLCNNTGILANVSVGGTGVLGLYGPLNGNYGKIDSKRRPVLMFNLNGTNVTEFESIVFAANMMGLRKGVISLACNKKNRRRMYGGFIWEYKEHISPEWINQWISAGVVKPFVSRELPPESFSCSRVFPTVRPSARRRLPADNSNRKEFLNTPSSSHQVQENMKPIGQGVGYS